MADFQWIPEAMGAVSGSIAVAAVPVAGFFGYYKWYVERKDRLRAQELHKREEELRKKEEALRAQVETEIHAHSHAIWWWDVICEFGQVEQDVQALLEDSSLDRFITFKAVNGYLSPKYTSAITQLRADGQSRVNYKMVELDDHYVGLLRAIAGSGSVYVVTEDLPQCILRDFYEYEKVTAAYIAHIATICIDEKHGLYMHLYCSIATHDPGLIPKDELTRCGLELSQLRHLAGEFDESMLKENESLPALAKSVQERLS